MIENVNIMNVFQKKKYSESRIETISIADQRKRALLNYKSPLRQQPSAQSTSSQDSEIIPAARRRVRQLTDSSVEEDSLPGSQENSTAGIECLALAFPSQSREVSGTTPAIHFTDMDMG